MSVSDRIDWDELTRVAREVLVGHGADEEQAGVVGEALSWCDAAGRPNQGVWRLPLLCERLGAGAFHCPCNLRMERRADAVYAVDGDAGMGHYVAVRAMQLAIDTARDHGVGVAAVRNSNFFGAGGYYADQAARAGCVGLVFSNSFPKVAAHGGTRPVLGTNPLAFGAPRAGGETFILDMSTSAAAGSTVTRAGEDGRALASDVAVDGAGRGTTDPGDVGGGALLPFGGAKGYGLALMVEILAGVLTGAAFASGVHSMVHEIDRSGENGQLLIAIDIGGLVPTGDFLSRMEQLAEMVCQSASDGSAPRFPGEVRWHRLREARARGIILEPATCAEVMRLAARAGVPWPIP